MYTALLLTLSNIFMTIAWYGHLKFKDSPLWKAILASWLIAFVEYCFQVPANRLGSERGFTAAQLKIMQEVITLVIFIVFSMIYFPAEKFRWNYAVGFALILLAVVVVYLPDWSKSHSRSVLDAHSQDDKVDHKEQHD